MMFTDISKKDIGWLKGYSSDDGIMISTRVRLARNLSDNVFPQRASREETEKVYNMIVSVVPSIPELINAKIYCLNEMEKYDKLFLVERHLISYEHASSNKKSGVIITDDERISIMINEEDHLRFQIIGVEDSFFKDYGLIRKISDKFQSKLKFAVHPIFGFLTACPTNVGTGLRVSYLLHLPLLILTGEIEKIINSLIKVGVNVRGFYGEGSRPKGDILQFSNSVTFGHSEEWIIENLEKVIKMVINYEKLARRKFLRNKLNKYKLEDQIYRAYGILSNAKMIDSDEVMSLLSKLRLGVSLKLKLPLTFDLLNQLMFFILPIHLQQFFNRAVQPYQRDILRAEVIKKKLEGLKN